MLTNTGRLFAKWATQGCVWHSRRSCVLKQMWEGPAQSRSRCGRGQPSPGADVGRRRLRGLALTFCAREAACADGRILHAMCILHGGCQTVRCRLYASCLLHMVRAQSGRAPTHRLRVLKSTIVLPSTCGAKWPPLVYLSKTARESCHQRWTIKPSRDSCGVSAPLWVLRQCDSLSVMQWHGRALPSGVAWIRPC